MAVMAVLLMSAAPAKADNSSPSASDLGALGYVLSGAGFTSTATVGVPGCGPTAFGAHCGGEFASVTGVGIMVFNASVSIPYDIFGTTSTVQIFNNNNATWEFAYCNGDTPQTGFICTAFVAIAAGTAQNLTVTGSGGTGTLGNIWIVLRANLPNIVANCTPSSSNNLCQDFGPDFFVNAVPEPGTLLLLGTAMLGLAAVRRKLS
jgi:hypothetical protein